MCPKILLQTSLDDEAQHLAQKSKSTQKTTCSKNPFQMDTLHWFKFLQTLRITQLDSEKLTNIAYIWEQGSISIPAQMAYKYQGS
jgi:uncharacterized protein YqcC (DUF446 family)